jgi:G3E family GTPase
MSELGSATPVTILTGFLGSGKTTLLNRLLSKPGMADTAVLINEFGEVGLDHLLVQEITEGVVLLSSGCICCTVQGELVDSLRDLYLFRLQGEVPKFERVVIETTGLADPAPIIAALVRDVLFKDWYRLEGIVTTVDAVNGVAHLDAHEEAVKQAAVADRIVLTKRDIAGGEDIAKLRQRLNRLNPAPVLEAVHGELDPDELFNVGLFDARTKSPDVRRWLNAEAHGDGGRDHDHGAPDVNRHDDSISTFCLSLEDPVDWRDFTKWLDGLLAEHGADLLRIKGIVNTQDGGKPLIIHCVQHIRHAPAYLPGWPDGDRRSRIVFITRDVTRAQVEATMDGLRGTADAAKMGA